MTDKTISFFSTVSSLLLRTSTHLCKEITPNTISGQIYVKAEFSFTPLWSSLMTIRKRLLGLCSSSSSAY
jgi:hypothetical protein